MGVWLHGVKKWFVINNQVVSKAIDVIRRPEVGEVPVGIAMHNGIRYNFSHPHPGHRTRDEAFQQFKVDHRKRKLVAYPVQSHGSDIVVINIIMDPVNSIVIIYKDRRGK
jgi:hypothetical protein